MLDSIIALRYSPPSCVNRETFLMMLLRAVMMSILLCAGVAGCGDHTGSGSRVSGDVIVNGPGWNGNVQADGSRRVFALRNVIAGYNYTVRTQIAPGGTLAGDIYQNQQDYLNSGPTFTSLVSHPTYTHIYEKNFTAPSSGDYYIALSGNNPIGFLYFYDLRLLSSSVTTSFATITTEPTATFIAENTALITPGYVHVYSGASLSSAGTYTVTVTSNSTTTLGNPQMFVYADSSLTAGSLLYSSYTTSTKYVIYTAASDTTRESDFHDIPGIAFSAAGPYIMIKGYSSIQYTVTIH